MLVPVQTAALPSVLLVDDNLDDRAREETARHLAQEGYTVVVVKNRNAAIATCEQVTPRLIVIGQVKYSIDPSSLLHELKLVLGASAPGVSFIVQRTGRRGETEYGLAPAIAIERLLDFGDVAHAA